MAYAVSRKITIDHTKVPGNLTDYPFGFITVDADLATVANGGSVQNTDANGGIDGATEVPADMIFAANADGSSPYDHEFEYYDKTTGEIVAWVRVPSVSGSVDTELYILYSDPAVVVSQENINAVWDSNFQGVWHLKEEQAGTGGVGVYHDSTSNANDGNDSVSAVGQDGIADGGQELDGDDDRIGVPDDPTLDLDLLDGPTIECWFKADTLAGTSNLYALVAKYHSVSGQLSYYLSCYDDDADGNYQIRGFAEDTLGNQIFGNANTDLTPGATWYYAVMVVVQSTRTINFYLQGSPDGSVTDTGGLSDIANTTEPLYFGARNGGGANRFDGYEDEIRLSKCERSADYIGAVRNNLNSPGTFFELGGQIIPRRLDHYLVEMETVATNPRRLDHYIVEMETGTSNKWYLDHFLVELELRGGGEYHLDHFITELEVKERGQRVSQLGTLVEHADKRRAMSQLGALVEHVDKRRLVSQLGVLIEYEACDLEDMTQIRGWNQIKACTIHQSRLSPSVGGRGIGGGGALGPLVLQPHRVEAATEPTVTSGEMWVWHDTTTGNNYLVYRDPVFGQLKCQLT